MVDTAQEMAQRLSKSTDTLAENFRARTQEVQDELDQAMKAWSGYLAANLKQQQALLETLTQYGKGRWESLLETMPRALLVPGSNGQATPEVENVLARLTEQDQALYQDLVGQLADVQQAQASLARELANIRVDVVQSGQKSIQDVAQYGQALLAASQGALAGSFATSQARAAKVHVKA